MTTRKNFPKRRALRIAEATERQTYYDELTLTMKIAQCVTRRGESTKELARLREQCT